MSQDNLEDAREAFEKYGHLLCSFGFATTRWHFRFSPVYDVFIYEEALAVVLASSKQVFADSVKPWALSARRHRARMRDKEQLGVETLLTEEEDHRLIRWSEVASCTLHKRRLGVSRLVLDLDDGSTLKLIWMPRGPFARMSGAASEVGDALRQVLGAKVTIE